MSEFYNEEMAWWRLQDLQREMENRRVVAGGGPVPGSAVEPRRREARGGRSRLRGVPGRRGRRLT